MTVGSYKFHDKVINSTAFVSQHIKLNTRHLIMIFFNYLRDFANKAQHSTGVAYKRSPRNDKKCFAIAINLFSSSLWAEICVIFSLSLTYIRAIHGNKEVKMFLAHIDKYVFLPLPHALTYF